MELHPDYNSLMRQIESKGYTTKIVKQDFSNIKISPEVEIRMITDPQGNFIRYEKQITLLEDMDYNTFLHEYGHIQQVEKALLEGKVLGPKGYIANSGGFKEVDEIPGLEWNIIEYHNRLKDLKRLKTLQQQGIHIPDIVLQQAKTGALSYKSLTVIKNQHVSFPQKWSSEK